MKDISKKKNTMYLLDKYHLHPTKKYGQNFIIDTQIIQKIVSSVPLDKETCVIEVGPGIGALTEFLSYQAGQVICFEIDERLKDVLKESLGEHQNIEIHFQDFLTVDLNDVIEKSGYKKVRVVSNLPYYITSDIIEHIISSNANIQSMHMMVQKEVASKLLDSTYKSPLKIMIESIGELSLEMNISSHVFYPSPRVESAILSLYKYHDYHSQLTVILNSAFQQKRKTIYNNLKSLFKDQTKEILSKCHIQEHLRPEQLTLNDYIELTKYL